MKRELTPPKSYLKEVLEILKRNKTAKFTTDSESGKPFMTEIEYKFSIVGGKLEFVLDFSNNVIFFYRHAQNIKDTHNFDFVIVEYANVGNASDIIFQNVHVPKGLPQLKGKTIVISTESVMFRQMSGFRKEVKI